MRINNESAEPIFQQIANGVEDAILSGAFPEEEQIPSTTEISVTYKINPATALKGITLLADGGILYKKRGIGMFVAEGARRKIELKRREAFFQNYILALVGEAKNLRLSEEDIKKMIESGFRDEH
ncbi:MAG: GntR family transcriptional regulator [Oscillospiraceae bacterium]|nr:GntR family transcriptional regulator [Oscillospiraceae bacterium]